jgi:hypothetical protein
VADRRGRSHSYPRRGDRYQSPFRPVLSTPRHAGAVHPDCSGAARDRKYTFPIDDGMGNGTKTAVWYSAGIDEAAGREVVPGTEHYGGVNAIGCRAVQNRQRWMVMGRTGDRGDEKGVREGWQKPGPALPCLL